MRIDYTPNDSWSQLNSVYRAALSRLNPVFEEPSLAVQIYRGTNHALLEITRGLSRLFAHKRTVAVIAEGESSLSPVLAPVIAELTTTDCKIVYLNRSLLAGAIGEWLDPIASQLLLVLHEVDDPVTAELYGQPSLFMTLKEKRIFRLGVSHFAHRYKEPARPAPLEGFVLSLEPDRALLVGGERFRHQSPIASAMPWGAVADVTIALAEERRGAVLAFEATLPDGFHAFLPEGAGRVYDRACIYSLEFDGSAVADALGSVADSVSPCRWGQSVLFDWVLSGLQSRSERADPELTAAGLVTIEASAINEQLSERLGVVAAKLRKLQSGEP